MKYFKMNGAHVCCARDFCENFEATALLAARELAAGFAWQQLRGRSAFGDYNCEMLFRAVFAGAAALPARPEDYFGAQRALGMSPGAKWLGDEDKLRLLRQVWELSDGTSLGEEDRRRLAVCLAAGCMLAGKAPGITPPEAERAYSERITSDEAREYLSVRPGSVSLSGRGVQRLVLDPRRSAGLRPGESIGLCRLDAPEGAELELYYGKYDRSPERFSIAPGDYRYLSLAGGSPVYLHPLTVKNGYCSMERRGGSLFLSVPGRGEREFPCGGRVVSFAPEEDGGGFVLLREDGLDLGSYSAGLANSHYARRLRSAVEPVEVTLRGSRCEVLQSSGVTVSNLQGGAAGSRRVCLGALGAHSGKKPRERVMDALTRRCREACAAGRPLIMVDTLEQELINELALSGALVGLEADDNEYAGREGRYFDFIGVRPDSFSRCTNLFFGPEGLEDFTQEAANALLAENVRPRLYVLASHELKGGLDGLRCFVREYLRCGDSCSVLRCSRVLLYGEVSALPAELLPYAEIIEPDYPDKLELSELVVSLCEAAGRRPPEGGDLQELASSLSGFGLCEARRLVLRLLAAPDNGGVAVMDDPPAREEMILGEKAQSLLRGGNILTLYRDRPGDNGGLGGMEEFVRWVDMHREQLLDPDGYMLTRGVPPLKGLLLCGVPGCGKSEGAKVLYRRLNRQLPLVILSVDRLMGSYIGESERNMRSALRQVEAMAPCIVLIDELDKGFAGASSQSQGDSGTFKRVFGQLLTWMQENSRACFIYATANSIGALPPEFFRSGRFDALFSVFMPSRSECVGIFAEHMRRAGARRAAEAESRGLPGPGPLFDAGDGGAASDCFSAELCLGPIVDAFGAAGKFLTGADIAKAVSTALSRLPLSRGRSITAPEWREALCSIAREADFASYGTGSSGLNSIAVNCVRMLRGSFIPAGEELFRRGNYRCCEDENGGVRAEYLSPGAPQNSYDRALYEAVLDRINRIASRIETFELHRLCES